MDDQSTSTLEYRLASGSPQGGIEIPTQRGSACTLQRVREVSLPHSGWEHPAPSVGAGLCVCMRAIVCPIGPPVGGVAPVIIPIHLPPLSEVPGGSAHQCRRAINALLNQFFRQIWDVVRIMLVSLSFGIVHRVYLIQHPQAPTTIRFLVKQINISDLYSILWRKQVL